ALPARGVHALRESALRAGLSCRGHGSQPRRTQRHGVQPLRRHTLLLEQLPVQSAALQFLAVRRLRDQQPAADAQPRGARALARRTTRGWWIGFGLQLGLAVVLLYTIGYLLLEGVGIWGFNIPVAWGFAIVNFVWWIGIGHAGTLISAILLVLHYFWCSWIN